LSSRVSRTSRQRLRVISIGTVLILFLWLAFSPFGFARYLKIQSRLAAIKQEVSILERENRIMEGNNEQLLHDQNYLEEVARKRYGLVKENEIIFDFNRNGR
jgi:cell division protein FtsB